MPEPGPIDHGAAKFLLLDQTRRRQEPEMMGKCRGGHLEAFLNLSHRQTVVASSDQRQKDLETGLRTGGAEPPRHLFQFQWHDFKGDI